MDTITEQIEGLESPTIAPAARDVEARKLARSSYAGFGLGILLSFAFTAYLVRDENYQNLWCLVFYLTWWPPLYLVVFRWMASLRGAGWPKWKWKWKWPRFRTQTLMMVIAYVAVLLGLAVQLVPLGIKAREYRQKSASADLMVKMYRGLARNSAVEAGKKRRSVEQLRAGKMPESLLPIQRDFLHSLDIDPELTPENRGVRRGWVTDVEERARISWERSALVQGKLVDYYEQLAAKYEKARRRPWLPVEPDPPTPPFQ